MVEMSARTLQDGDSLLVGLLVTRDDVIRVKTIANQGLCLVQKLSSENKNKVRRVSDLEGRNQNGERKPNEPQSS
jgi:hypothetical protein